MTPKKIKFILNFFHIYILTQKVLIRLLLYLSCKLLLNRGYMWTKMGPVWLLNPPPPPPGPHIATDINMFSHICQSQPRWLSGLTRSCVHSQWLLVDQCVLSNWDRILVRAVKGLISRAGMVSICPLLWQRDVKLQQTYMSNLLSIVFPCCAYVSSVMRSSWHFSSSGFNIRFPRTPQNENKNLKKCSSDYFHILHIVELWCDFKKFVGPWSIYIFIKCLWVLLTNVFWFRATGGYICGCGRPSNLVINGGAIRPTGLLLQFQYPFFLGHPVRG